VKWSAVPQAKSYTVSWRVAGTAKWKSKTVKAKVKSGIITGLKSKTKYDVRVRAVTTIGKTKYVGAWSAAKRAKVK
ncbi:MAG: fibronectin type III domain-containing protein, partial [Bifidobacteriaceae bacterium]|nr:fibronectin type III domain-containing protein [Bifidobacteriaceae bacterium]